MSWDFRSEEDVKEYLHNIGIEYRFGCYSEKKPEVCHLLGMYFDVIKKNVEQAKKVYKVNCDTYRWSHSCYKYAYLKDQEKKDEQKDEVINYFEKGCEAGLNRSCYLAGVKVGAKAEQETNFTNASALFNKAIDYMSKACEDDFGQACFNLSSIYFNGIPQIGMARNFQKMFEYSVKGCDRLHLNCCVNAALMAGKGEGTEKNEELAKKYRAKAEELHKDMTEEGLKFEEGLRK
ncbi:cytochrome c oxidase assembly factor 7 homolog [Planococcus citri]|uniref:cytochrome c oxidase assembly factor 7 homolog n=1 Tax=Planococcus citri TaxID=170843 RepID=UPI0031FA2E5B